MYEDNDEIIQTTQTILNESKRTWGQGCIGVSQINMTELEQGIIQI